LLIAYSVLNKTLCQSEIREKIGGKLTPLVAFSLAFSITYHELSNIWTQTWKH